MVIEGISDGEAEYLRRVREIVGPDMPIVMELDLHANISPESVDMVDVMIGYDTYPHVDVYDRAIELTHLLKRIVDGEIKPAHAFRQIRSWPTFRPSIPGRPRWSSGSISVTRSKHGPAS
ncbi:MAG: M81 family metallopeptidase [Thermomicrobiales bacterium]